MSLYQHILVAVELDSNAEFVLKRARELSVVFGAKLSVLNVVEYIALDTGEMMMPTPIDLTRQLQEKAQIQLRELCDKIGVKPQSLTVLCGQPPNEILNSAKELGADLIAIGHELRHGFFATFFSHTEEAVVSHSFCDVMVLSLPKA